MARPSKLSDKQWAEIGRRLANGETVTDLAKKFKVNKAQVSRRFSQQIVALKTLAADMVSVDTRFASLPVSQQSCVMSLADQLKSIQDSYSQAARDGAETAAILQALAKRKAGTLDDLSPVEDVRGVAALTETAKSAAAMATNLISANKEKVEEEPKRITVITGVPR